MLSKAEGRSPSLNVSPDGAGEINPKEQWVGSVGLLWKGCLVVRVSWREGGGTLYFGSKMRQTRAHSQNGSREESLSKLNSATPEVSLLLMRYRPVKVTSEMVKVGPISREPFGPEKLEMLCWFPGTAWHALMKLLRLK
jgi:hypothetical protein